MLRIDGKIRSGDKISNLSLWRQGVYLLFLLCLGFTHQDLSPVWAEELPTLDYMITKIQEVYDSTEDLQAVFEQVSTSKSWGQTQVARGKVALKKNGRMRWEYLKPLEQKIICDGSKIWFYIPQDRQVTVYERGEGFNSEIVSKLLLGKCNLRKDFEINWESNPSKEGTVYRLRLKPIKSQPGVDHIILSVNKNTFQIFETMIVDNFGNSNFLKFTSLKLNSQLTDSIFNFIVPEGVQVVKSPKIPQTR